MDKLLYLRGYFLKGRFKFASSKVDFGFTKLILSPRWRFRSIYRVHELGHESHMLGLGSGCHIFDMLAFNLGLKLGCDQLSKLISLRLNSP